MPITLQDPVHLEIPSRSPVRPAAPLDPEPARDTRRVSFDVESPGGYLRTVTGTIAYLDAEAETYMVLASDGDLIRVPLRDIKRTIESVAGRGHGHGSRPSRVLRSETMPYGPDPIARHESEVVT